MRLEAPLYEGDGLIRPGPVVSDRSLSVRGETDMGAELVHRNTIPDAAPSEAVDIAAIEARARALRAATIAAWFARLGERLNEWLESARRRQAEEYLARAQSHAELEARLRELERRGYLPHI
jgi:hypothetical protein